MHLLLKKTSELHDTLPIVSVMVNFTIGNRSANDH